MTKLPLVSSKVLVAALERDGFHPKRKSKGGSHQTFCKDLPDGRVLVTVVVLGKREIPRGTLASILRRAEISHDKFLNLLRGQ